MITIEKRLNPFYHCRGSEVQTQFAYHWGHYSFQQGGWMTSNDIRQVLMDLDCERFEAFKSFNKSQKSPVKRISRNGRWVCLYQIDIVFEFALAIGLGKVIE